MKRLFSILILLTVSIVLIGCEEKETLRTVSMFGGTDANATVYEEIIAEFIEDTGWKVKDNSATADQEWKASIVSMFANGNEPDVIQFFTGNDAKSFVDSKQVMSIEEIREEYPDYAKNINPDLLGTHSVPTTGFVEGIFTNTNHFKSEESKAFLDKDNWTWDEFLELLDLLVEENSDKDGYKPIAMGQNIPHYWIDHVVVAMYGEDYYNVITGENGAEKLADALLLLADLEDYVSYEASEEDASEAFIAGEYTFQLDGSWFMGRVEIEETTVVPFPIVDEEIGSPLLSGYTSGFYITRKAWENEEKREKAVQFVEMMTSTESLTRFVTAAGGFAADDDAVEEEANALTIDLGNLAQKTKFPALPLGDASKKGYDGLVASQSAYFKGDKEDTLKAAEEYFNDETD